MGRDRERERKFQNGRREEFCRPYRAGRFTTLVPGLTPFALFFRPVGAFASAWSFDVFRRWGVRFGLELNYFTRWGEENGGGIGFCLLG